MCYALEMAQPTKRTTPVNVRFPQALYEMVKEVAEDRGVTISSLVIEAVSVHLMNAKSMTGRDVA